MLTIHRYVINDAINKIKIPSSSEILSVGVAINEQTGKEEISVWVKCDDSDILTEKTFLVFGTGADMSSTVNFDCKFIGTVRRANRWAFHIFEVDNNTNR